jgi:hypothetical protein
MVICHTNSVSARPLWILGPRMPAVLGRARIDSDRPTRLAKTVAFALTWQQPAGRLVRYSDLEYHTLTSQYHAYYPIIRKNSPAGCPSLP